MLFLTQLDLDTYIIPTYLQQLTTSGSIRLSAEEQAVEECAGYLTSRYDTETIFRTPSPFNSGSFAGQGTRIYSGSTIKVSAVDQYMTAFESGSWLPDDRPKQLIKPVFDCFIWNLIQRTQGARIEEIRSINYSNAIQKLKDFVRGTSTLIGAPVRSRNQGNLIIWGSDQRTEMSVPPIQIGSRDSYSVDSFQTNVPLIDASRPVISVESDQLSYLAAVKTISGTVILPNTVTFASSWIEAPAGIPATSLYNFNFFVNGVLIEPAAVTSFTQFGNTSTLVLNTTELGFSLSDSDEIIAIGKFK